MAGRLKRLKILWERLIELEAVYIIIILGIIVVGLGVALSDGDQSVVYAISLVIVGSFIVLSGYIIYENKDTPYEFEGELEEKSTLELGNEKEEQEYIRNEAKREFKTEDVILLGVLDLGQGFIKQEIIIEDTFYQAVYIKGEQDVKFIEME